MVPKGSARNPEAEKLPEFASFDVLRFALASAVMLGHSGVLRWVKTGDLAVQVFFALSGWLIGGILCRTEARELSRFYFNRSTRIWIPFAFAIFALYLVSYLHEPVRSGRWWEFLVYDVTFTHNWFTLRPDAAVALQQMPLRGTGNHFWSLAVEEQFYLLAPLIMTLLPFGKRILPWVVIAAIAYGAASQYGAISLGVLAAVAANRTVDWYRGRLVTTALLLIAAISAAAMNYPSIYVYAAPLFAVCVVLLCARPSRRNAATRWLGGISFPFYLNAWMGTFVLHFIEKKLRLDGGGYWLGLEFVAGVAAAAVTYWLIDARVMAHRNAYYTAPLGWALGATGYMLIIGGVVLWSFIGR
jgi:peptidoglycan/LPS O-acetylase OafA/YrhL